MPSVRKVAGIKSLYSLSVSDAKGAAPLLCQVSSTNGSRCISAPHFSHFILILSIQGRWSSKSGPSGKSIALLIISALEKRSCLLEQFRHGHIGRGVPHSRSLDIHQGCCSLIISIYLFRGGSKKYSTLSAASSGISPSFS